MGHNIISYRMVVLPFRYVPHRVAFRYGKNWWIKKIGTTDYANIFDSNNSKKIDLSALVVMSKGMVETNIARVHIVDEFNVGFKK